MPADLLFEVGTEEIPAAVLDRVLQHIDSQIRAALTEARLQSGPVQVLGTPRRLVVCVGQLADRQPDLEERVVGPPARVAFDGDGKPTKAAAGFAKRNGVDVSTLERSTVEGKKGEYVVCTRREPGRAAAEVLPPLLVALMGDLPWPKSMRWGNGEHSFIRPVHWVVALLGAEVLPLSFAGITSGNLSRGHRFSAPEPVPVSSAMDDYIRVMEARDVIVDPAARRHLVAAELDQAQQTMNGEAAAASTLRVRPDDELLAEVANLVEYPSAICGSFAAHYLELPEEVIVSAMRAHQRYFAVEDAAGVLTNRFVAIAGTKTRDASVVRAGNERVLAARLADAAFFFREDQKAPLTADGPWAQALADVVFQADLGTMAAKVARVQALAAAIADQLGIAPDAAVRASALCKVDLVSQMVYEFPDLQGVMGRHYARLAGEAGEVCDAIYEHYLPRGAGDVMPATDAGAIVAIADRVDTLVGCFAVGLIPSGSADPYGLRRAALGILGILLDRGWSLPLSWLVERAAETLAKAPAVPVSEADIAAVLGFLRTRLKGVLGDLPTDCIEAALAVGYDNVPDARARAASVAALRERDDFTPLATAFKRVANILKSPGDKGGGAKGGAKEDNGRGGQAAGDPRPASAPDPALWVDDAERDLWRAFGDCQGRVGDLIGTGEYGAALGVLAELKAPVDRFFDEVLVMDPDMSVRQNRLALLGQINGAFAQIADFRCLSV